MKPYKRPRRQVYLCDPREVHRVVVWFGKNGYHRMLPSDAYGVFKERFDLDDAYADLVKLRDTSFKPATRFSLFHASVVTYDRLLGPPEYIEREKIFEIDDPDIT